MHAQSQRPCLVRGCPRLVRSSRREHLARVEYAIRVQHRLEPAHELNLLRSLRQMEEARLAHTDAVLGGDRAAPFGDPLEYVRLDLREERVGALEHLRGAPAV